jgi:DNA-binding XRE family transcriptional regulator
MSAAWGIPKSGQDSFYCTYSPTGDTFDFRKWCGKSHVVCVDVLEGYARCIDHAPPEEIMAALKRARTEIEMNEPMAGTTIGALFRRLRKLAGFNMAEAAEKLDVSVPTISCIENDVLGVLPVPTVKREQIEVPRDREGSVRA